jgi:drug/metabolite transporter (DMT)-like permease
MNQILGQRQAVALLFMVVLVWGLTWACNRFMVNSITPFWITSIRCAIATVVLYVFLKASRQFVLPRREDFPVILSVALLHIVAFSTLVNFGLRTVPLGRSIVLGYSTPLWVVPGATLFLGEGMSKVQFAGVVLGLAGLALMFNPATFDWQDTKAIYGNGLLLLAALCWALNILYVRWHRWVSSPFQLTFWQMLLAFVLSSAIAFTVDGSPDVVWTPPLVGAMSFVSIFGAAFAYWAMAVANRNLPAVTTSLVLLATPVIGVICSSVFFGELVGLPLLISMAMILGGIALGTLAKTA